MKPPTAYGPDGHVRKSKHRIANIRQEQMDHDQNINPNTGLL